MVDEDLERVRKALQRMVEQRLLVAFTPRELARYDQLLAEERDLLQALPR